MIDQVTAQKIKDTADIVDVVSDYVHLTRRGANYMGLCPFHNERTPSFSVNRRKNFCFCFSCKKGGSPVNFIMEKEGLSYHDALLHLAKKYGIEVQERELTDEERKAQSEREAMLVANEWAMQKMEKDIHNSEEGRDIGLQYLFQRGVTEEAARAFHLGYALDKSNALTSAAKIAGYDIEVLKKLGLVGQSGEGREYDRFRGRVIFPIINSAGKVIAFGGRDLKGGMAKYINSPESALYKKSNELYGIYQARQDIVRDDKCYLVEGYLDVIGMWQSGMKNTVASSGTALTDGQIALIHRFTENITLIYDGDAAGIKASLRGIDMLLNHKMKVKVLLLPDGDDPDSFARKHTPEEFRKYVAEHETDIIRFKAQVLLSDIQKDPQRRIEAVNSVVESLAHIPDPISRDVYIQECSSILGISEETVAKSVARVRGQLVEKWKRDRVKKDYPDNTQQAPAPEARQYQPSGNYTPAQAVVTHVPSYQTQERKLPKYYTEATSLEPLERRILECCVKYGMLDLVYTDSETGKPGSINVIELVVDELSADNISFSIPVYHKIFSLLQEINPIYKNSLAQFRTSLEQEISSRRNEGIQKIGEADLSVIEIEKAEKKLEKELNIYRQEAVIEFAKDYPARQLASHEDAEVRATVTDLIRERHQLSHIYYRDGNVVEKEEDKLWQLIPRAITELKNEMLNLKLKDVFAQFHAISGKGDSEAERKLQTELNHLIQLRSKVAKEIGDRIIYAPRRK